MARMEQMEKNQQELQEILARDREEHREQMAQVIIRLSREKEVVDDADFVNTVSRVQGVTKGPTYPFAIPAIQMSVYLPLHAFSSNIKPPVTQVEVNPATLFTQALPRQNSKEQKEQQRKGIVKIR